MEIIIDNNRLESVSGKLISGCGYRLAHRNKRDGTTGIFAVRDVPYNRFYSDCRHSEFIECMANTVKSGSGIGFVDLRLTVREFIDARVSAACGRPLRYFGEDRRKLWLRYWCNIISMRFRKVKPTSILNADDVLKLLPLLYPKGINR